MHVISQSTAGLNMSLRQTVMPRWRLRLVAVALGFEPWLVRI